MCLARSVAKRRFVIGLEQHVSNSMSNGAILRRVDKREEGAGKAVQSKGVRDAPAPAAHAISRKVWPSDRCDRHGGSANIPIHRPLLAKV